MTGLSFCERRKVKAQYKHQRKIVRFFLLFFPIRIKLLPMFFRFVWEENLFYSLNRGKTAHLVEHRVVMREVVSSTPDGPTLR